MDQSLWRVLIKRGPVEKGMVIMTGLIPYHTHRTLKKKLLNLNRCAHTHTFILKDI